MRGKRIRQPTARRSGEKPLYANRIQRIQDLEMAPSYGPNIPCKAHHELSGYTIKIV